MYTRAKSRWPIIGLCGIGLLSIGALVWFFDLAADTSEQESAAEASSAPMPIAYECADDNTVVTDFAVDGQQVEVTTPAGEVVLLLRQSDDAVGRYEGVDGAMVLHTDESDAFLAESGERVVTDCQPVYADEGTADRAAVDEQLLDAPWRWVETAYETADTVRPEQSEAFQLTFQDDGQVAATTDCNTMMGSYEVSAANGIAFGEMASTLMYCEGSQEMVYRSMLAEAETYAVNEAGSVLTIELESEGGVMEFIAVSDTDD